MSSQTIFVMILATARTTLTNLADGTGVAPRHQNHHAAGGNNVTLAIVEGIASASASEKKNGRVWQAIMSTSAWADLAVIPAGVLAPGGCDEAGQAATSLKASLPIVASCASSAGSEVVALVTTADGKTIAITAAQTQAGNSTAALHLKMGTVTIGISVGSNIWDPLQPRQLMLHGAELLVVLDAATPSRLEAVTTAEDAMLLTRGFENVVGALRARATPALSATTTITTPPPPTSVASTLANWCNDMLPPGCPDGSMLLPLTPVPPTTPGNSGDSIVRGTFSLDDLRLQRSTGIWGDAFRRPFTYQPLCGLGVDPTTLPSSAASPMHTDDNDTNTDDNDTNSNTNTTNNHDTHASTPPFKVKVALLQMETCYNTTECTAKAEVYVRKAAAEGADIAVTPEMWSVGYSATWLAGQVPIGDANSLHAAYRWTHQSQTVEGPYITRMRAVAKELGIAIAAGMMRRDPGDAVVMSLWPPHNSVVFIDRHGEVAYVYDKVHTCVWGADEALTTPGRQWMSATVNTKAGNLTIGSMICADREFPESARTLALHGVELILTPNACGLVDAQLRQFSTRAVENVLGVAMANYAKSPSCCNGRSVAYGPDGAAVAGPGTEEEQVLYATFDVAAIRAARETAFGKAQLQPLKGVGGTHAAQPKLCELRRMEQFARQNVYGRVSGPTV